MPLYKQFQDLFRKKLNSSYPTAIALFDLKILWIFVISGPYDDACIGEIYQGALSL